MHKLLRRMIQNRLADMIATGAFPPSHPDRALLTEALKALGGDVESTTPLADAVLAGMTCTGPFSDAFDCPVHDPRRRTPEFITGRDLGDETPAH